MSQGPSRPGPGPPEGEELRQGLFHRVVARLPLLAGAARRVLKRNWRGRDEPLDVVGDAVVKVLNMPTTALRRIRSFTEYMKRAVVNSARERNRGYARPRTDTVTEPAELPAPGPTVDEEAAAHEHRQLTLSLLANLTGWERELADLIVDPSVRDFAEIRRRLGISDELLRQRRHRLFARLQNARQLLKAVQRCRPVDGLYARLVRLRYLGGLSPAEIATIMGCSEAPVRRWLAELRGHLPEDLRGLLS